MAPEVLADGVYDDKVRCRAAYFCSYVNLEVPNVGITLV